MCKKYYDARLEALCYTLEQVWVNKMQILSTLGDDNEGYLNQLKQLAGEIMFRDEELLSCFTREEYEAMIANAQSTYYRPSFVANITKAHSLDDIKIFSDIADCKRELWRCADDPGHIVSISVGGKAFHFYDHAALIGGLSDALDYFESEL